MEVTVGTRISHWADILIIVLYFIFILGVGLWTLYRPNRGSLKGYFLAGRDMTWLPVGASLFASNIGSEHFIGLAGTGAASGIAIVMYEWMSMPLVLLLAWLFMPVYVSAGVFTLPEYMEKRFGSQRLRVYLSCLSLLLYIITKIAVSIYAGALFIQLSLGWNMYLAIAVLLVITGIYTVFGGLAAVIYTDAVQTVIMTIGSIILAVVAFMKIYGYNALEYKYLRAVPAVRDENTTCGIPQQDAMHMFRDPIHSDNPWPGLLLQSSIGCLWYWCADQVIVQRALAARNVAHSKGGAVVAGYLKLLPLFLIIFPGMISRILYPDEIGCVDPNVCEAYCGNRAGCSNIAYPTLVMTLLPVGLRGLLMAVMLSAVMSSLTSIFNSSSTLFTMDLWRRLRPAATQRELMIIGRLAILVLCIVSILWVPLVESSAGGQLFVYIQQVQGYLGTPIGLVFLLAVLWRRMTEQGAFWGLMIGHASGVTRMVLDFAYPAPPCGEEDTRPDVVGKLHYTYFSQLNLILTGLAIAIISHCTTRIDEAQLGGVTWWTRKQPLPSEGSMKMTPAADPETKDHDGMHLVETHPDGPDPDGTDQEGIHPDGTDPEGLTHSDDPRAEPGLKAFCSRLWQFLWGVDSADAADADATSKNQESFQDRMKLLLESKRTKRILNINAAVAMAATCFLFGFYH